MAVNTSKKAPPSRGASDKKTRLIYLGPSMGDAMLKNGQVFKGGMPSHLSALLRDMPELERLFVPVDQAIDAIKKLSDQSSEESRVFALAGKGRRN